MINLDGSPRERLAILLSYFILFSPSLLLSTLRRESYTSWSYTNRESEGILLKYRLCIVYPLFAALKQWLKEILTQFFLELGVIRIGKGKGSRKEALHTLRDGAGWVNPTQFISKRCAGILQPFDLSDKAGINIIQKTNHLRTLLAKQGLSPDCFYVFPDTFLETRPEMLTMERR